MAEQKRQKERGFLTTLWIYPTSPGSLTSKLYPERIYPWVFEPLLLGEDGGHLNAAEANLDTDEEDLEGREQKGH